MIKLIISGFLIYAVIINLQIKMPKKFVGENSKAVAARARKAAAKEAENTKKALEAEEKAWQDDDKQLLKKKQKQVFE